ncbi:unnamed protein product [Allacma fusca]|uniref:Uncharacterized protein n=1 Tax=Allacma fusca TaxID=39272 RepID=A0A8J2K9H9_9HEXA|nr:unnamed protein product [Allacma fusca]
MECKIQFEYTGPSRNGSFDPGSDVLMLNRKSDDSDAEGGLGNVTRVVLRPPGHSGKAKRGHLCFDASYECGNLGRVDFISEFEYDLFIRPDTCNPRYSLLCAEESSSRV